MSTQRGVILTDLLLLLDQSPLLLQDSGILLICRILHNDSSSYRARTVVPLRDISCGSYHNHIYHIYLRLASLRFLLFTFNSWTHLFWKFLLFYGIHCWVHPSIFFSGCLNSFRGLDQFQPLFQASILRPNRDTFRELLCTCSGKTYKHNRKQAWSRMHTSNRMDVILYLAPVPPVWKPYPTPDFFPTYLLRTV